MDNTDLSVEEIIKLAVAAGRTAAERAPSDAFKATERRLYALPILREKLERDQERLPTLDDAARTDLEAVIAADADEVKTMESALANFTRDAYYQTISGRYFDGLDDEEIGKLLHCDGSTIWRNRKRLIQRVSVYLYGVFAVR